MRPLCILVLCAFFLVGQGDAKRKRKFEGDFEFAEEVRYFLITDLSASDYHNILAADLGMNVLWIGGYRNVSLLHVLRKLIIM